MLTVDDYGAIRRARRDGKSIRQIASEFEHSRNTIRKILKQAEPNPLPSTRDRFAPLLGPVQAVIDQILIDDESAPPKQRHTAAQVFRRLRDEHGYRGGYAQVQRYVLKHRRRASGDVHPPGTPAGSAARGRFRTHPRRLPRRSAPGPLPRDGLGLLQRSLRAGAALRTHRGDPRRHGRRPSSSSAACPGKSGGTTPRPSPP